jgi:hypothetical protein
MKRFRLPSEIPIEEYPSPEEFINEAIAIVEGAKERGITLRVIGGMAIYMHSKEYEDLWKRLKRLGAKVFTDIDLAGYSKERDKIAKFLAERGYEVDQRLLMYYGRVRQIYYSERIPMVEVFLDRLAMNHTIEFKGRLERDPLTLPLAELLLEKLQIVRMNDKDFKDSIVLLRAHEFGWDDNDKINLEAFKIQGLFDDWGFWYTVTTNLQLLRSKLDEYDIEESHKVVVRSRIDELLKYLNETPKSKKWEKRAKIGTKEKWYNEVEEWH